MFDFREITEKYIRPLYGKLSFLKHYISGRTALIALAAVIGVSALVAGIRIIPPLFSGSGKTEKAMPPDDLVEIEIDISDFLIPEDIKSIEEFRWVPYRGMKKKWSREDAEEFWINPEETVRKAAGERNRKHMEELFESIP